jgi:mannose-6-phosphate isomerase-like protein (cupin superfamily)
MTRLHPTIALGVVALLSALLPAAAQQQPVASPAPAPGSPGLYVTADELAQQLDAAIAKGSDPATASIGVTDQYAIHEVHRGKSGPAAVHPGWTELHFILDGSATFVTGGTMTPGRAATIEGGVSRKVKKGDAIIVPPNTPHWYSQVDDSMTYLEVRFIAPGSPPPSK